MRRGRSGNSTRLTPESQIFEHLLLSPYVLLSSSACASLRRAMVSCLNKVGRPRGRPILIALVGATAGVRDLRHHLIEVEAGRGLAGREFFKAAEPLTDISSCGDDQVDAVEPPVRIVDAFVFSSLERIRMQVKQFGDAQLNEGCLPDREAMSRLLQKQHLPAVITQGGGLTIVGPVKK